MSVAALWRPSPRQSSRTALLIPHYQAFEPEVLGEAAGPPCKACRGAETGMPGSAHKRRKHNDNDVTVEDAALLVKVHQASEVPTACHGTYKVRWKKIR